jgi:uncharacterized protein (PEP-CTERM system associated)
MEGLPIIRLALIGWVGLVAAVATWDVNAGDGAASTGAGGAFTATDNLNFALPGQATPAVGRAPAREWTFSARGAGTLTLTDNVNLAPPGQEKADLVLGLSLPLGLRREGSRVKVLADYTPTFYLYAKSPESDILQNNLRSLMTVKAIDDFFFVDASANIYQTYISPSGARPVSGANTTDNRTQQTTLGLSPYIRHNTSGGWTYLVRNDNLWNAYSAAGLANSALSRVAADVTTPPARLRYGFDYTYLYTRDDSQPAGYYQQVARVRPILALTPRISVSARLGYETNDYVAHYSGPVYGAGVHWTPDPRTRLDGFLEHRFFGPSYALNFTHRTRLTAWTLGATSNIYTSLEQPLALRPATTAEVLDNAFQSRIADPAEREQAVQQFQERAGLPPSLTQPYSFYTNQVYRAQQVSASVALLPKRNTAVLTLLWQENQPITTGGGGQSVVFAGSSPFRQQGFTLTLSHRLSAFANVTLTANRLYSSTESSGVASAAAQDKSIQDTVLLSLTHQLSPKTDGSIGVRWVNFSSVSSPYQELALIAVLGHSF